MWPFKKKDTILFNFNINRRTGDDEQISVTFNGFKGESPATIEDRLTMIGGILHNRMALNNKLVIDSNKKVHDAMNLKKNDKTEEGVSD